MNTQAAYIPRTWQPALTSLPTVVGPTRPFRIGRHPTIVQLPSWGASWGIHGPRGFPQDGIEHYHAPKAINVIQVIFGGERTPARRVLEAFDMEQCKVVMEAGSKGLSFACSEATRACAESRRIRLTEHAFMPLVGKELPTPQQEVADQYEEGASRLASVLKDSIEGFKRRVNKYERYGFKLTKETFRFYSAEQVLQTMRDLSATSVGIASEAGCAIEEVIEALDLSSNRVRGAALRASATDMYKLFEHLVSEGYIYSTIDDDHFKVTS